MITFIPFRNKIISHFSPWSFRKAVLVVCAVLLFFENALLITNYMRRDMPVLGLKLYGVNISGLSRPRMASLAHRRFLQTHSGLKLETPFGKIFFIKPADIGAEINTNHLAEQLISVGRNKGLIQNIFEQNKAFWGRSNWTIAEGTVSQTLLTLKILELQDAINQDAIPALPDFSGDLAKTLPAKSGIQVDTLKLSIRIAQNIFHPSPVPLPIPVKAIPAPSYDPKDMESIRRDAAGMLKEKMSVMIRSGGKIFALTPDDLKHMLTVVGRPDSRDPKILRPHLRLDESILNRKLGQFADEVEKVTGAEFDDHDARVAIYAQIFGGIRKTFEIPTGKGTSGFDVSVAELPHHTVAAQNVTGATQDHHSSFFAGAGYALSEGTGAPTVLPTEKTAEKFAYLTFDDGPNAVYHPLILDILKKYNIKATFFLVGNNTLKYSDIAKRTLAEGHKIGNHSLTHAFLPKLPAKEIMKEVQETEAILKPINNDQDIVLFRPPYGGVNRDVRTIAKNDNLRLTLWSVDPRDWSEPAIDDLVNRVVSHTHNGSDILLHSNHLATVRALPKIIELLQKQEYGFKLLP